MTDRIKDGLGRLAETAVDAAVAHGRGEAIQDLNGGGQPPRRRGLVLTGVAVLILAVLGVVLLATPDGSKQLDTTGPGLAPTVTWPPAPACLADGGVPDESFFANRSTPAGDAVAAALLRRAPGFEVTMRNEHCGYVQVTAMDIPESGPSRGSITAIYAYSAPDQDLEADCRLNFTSCRDLDGLPAGMHGVSNAGADASPQHLVVEQQVSAGRAPIAVTIASAGTPPAGMTDDDAQTLAVEIISSIPPPS